MSDFVPKIIDTKTIIDISKVIYCSVNEDQINEILDEINDLDEYSGAMSCANFICDYLGVEYRYNRAAIISILEIREMRKR